MDQTAEGLNETDLAEVNSAWTRLEARLEADVAEVPSFSANPRLLSEPILSGEVDASMPEQAYEEILSSMQEGTVPQASVDNSNPFGFASPSGVRFQEMSTLDLQEDLSSEEAARGAREALKRRSFDGLFPKG